jgi:hypothetical protein
MTGRLGIVLEPVGGPFDRGAVVAADRTVPA